MRKLRNKNKNKGFFITQISTGAMPQRNRGFTLIELIVSLGLFTVVIMISTGAMLSMSETNRKVEAMRIAMDNLNLAVESISREIRMGSVYTCNPSLPLVSNLTYGGVGVDCSGGGSSLAFLSQNNDTIVYKLKNGVVQRSKNGGSVGSFSSITSPNIKINNFKFYVLGTGATNNQPHIIISIVGTVSGKSKTSFKMQTTVTQRLPK